MALCLSRSDSLMWSARRKSCGGFAIVTVVEALRSLEGWLWTRQTEPDKKIAQRLIAPL